MFINHWHTAPEKVYDKDAPDKGTLKEIISIMRQLDISGALAFAPFVELMPYDDEYKTNMKLNNERECNKWLYETLKEYPSIYGFVTVNPANPAAVDILEEYIHKGFLGAKIHPPVFRIKINEPVYDNFYSCAEELNVPVLFHTGSHGWQVDNYAPGLIGDIARRHSDLKIILEHTGGPDFFNEAVRVLRENPNCYTGISSTLRPTCEDGKSRNISCLGKEKIIFLIETFGSERIIYGSDYPNNYLEDIRADINFIQNLKISNKDKNNILGKSLTKILRKSI
ncbi:MAG: amidohydrolase family protein [Victivallaceae bacterium]|jgi:predicted TIM-barrel fold metal-dependent hydrolase